MTVLSANTSLRQVHKDLSVYCVPIYAAAKIYEGALVCLRTADGYAVTAGTASTGRVIGVAQHEQSIPTASGDYSVYVLTGQFARPVHGSTPPTAADVGKAVYADDDSGLISTDSSVGPLAGILVGFEDGSGDAIFYIAPPGAGEVGLGSIRVPIASGIVAAGTPMAAFADNAASNPGITLVDSEGVGIRWNNNGTQAAVWTSFMLPRDIDTSKDATLVFKASKVGATVGDAVTFTCTAFNQATGALHDADANYGGASSAMTGNATSKTVQECTLTLAAADLGLAGDNVSLSFKPTDGTLGTDDVILFGIEFRYRKKS